MLSNKMTVSLMSLITIIRSCFRGTFCDGGGIWRVTDDALPVMQDADGRLLMAVYVLMDVSHDDGLQVSTPAADFSTLELL